MINVGSGTDVLTFPVWLGLRHINAHVFVRKWIAAQTGEPGAQNGRKIAWDKLQEAARTPNNGDSTNRPLCMQNASRLHPNIVPSDRKEWVNFWKRWVCSRVSRTEKLSALWTWYKCFLLLPRDKQKWKIRGLSSMCWRLWLKQQEKSNWGTIWRVDRERVWFLLVWSNKASWQRQREYSVCVL